MKSVDGDCAHEEYVYEDEEESDQSEESEEEKNIPASPLRGEAHTAAEPDAPAGEEASDEAAFAAEPGAPAGEEASDEAAFAAEPEAPDGEQPSDQAAFAAEPEAPAGEGASDDAAFEPAAGVEETEAGGEPLAGVQGLQDEEAVEEPSAAVPEAQDEREETAAAHAPEPQPKAEEKVSSPQRSAGPLFKAVGPHDGDREVKLQEPPAAPAASVERDEEGQMAGAASAAPAAAASQPQEVAAATPEHAQGREQEAFAATPENAQGREEEEEEAFLTPGREAPAVEPRGEDTQAVIDALSHVYAKRLLPLEEVSYFGAFHSEPLTRAELKAKPMVLVVGPYSSGKTSFIAHLLRRPYPAMHVGPEPTTDGFRVLMAGPEERTIAGTALCAAEVLPFTGLQQFGTAFLSRLVAPVLPSPLLDQVILVDTPGILGGDSQAAHHGYPFAEVARWFAERSDLIVLMFDPLRLGVSEEMRAVLDAVAVHSDKCRVVLNKAQEVDGDALVRVYGSLMLSVGESFRGKSEAPKVFVGSFWDGPRGHPSSSQERKRFSKDEAELLREIASLPNNAGLNKMDAMLRRARLLKAHVCVLGHLSSHMPWLWRREAVQQRLLDDLEGVFRAVKAIHRLPDGDMPDVELYRRVLSDFDLSDLRRVSSRTLRDLDKVIRHDIANCARSAGSVASFYRLDVGVTLGHPAVAAAKGAKGAASEAPDVEGESGGAEAGEEEEVGVWRLLGLMIIVLLTAVAAIVLSVEDEAAGKKMPQV